MDILHPAAVIGTNAWGSAAYSVIVRGSKIMSPDLFRRFVKKGNNGGRL